MQLVDGLQRTGQMDFELMLFPGLHISRDPARRRRAWTILEREFALGSRAPFSR